GIPRKPIMKRMRVMTVRPQRYNLRRPTYSIIHQAHMVPKMPTALPKAKVEGLLGVEASLLHEVDDIAAKPYAASHLENPYHVGKSSVAQVDGGKAVLIGGT